MSERTKEVIFSGPADAIRQMAHYIRAHDSGDGSGWKKNDGGEVRERVKTILETLLNEFLGGAIGERGHGMIADAVDEIALLSGTPQAMLQRWPAATPPDNQRDAHMRWSDERGVWEFVGWLDGAPRGEGDALTAIRQALQVLEDAPGINPSNYDHDDVVALDVAVDEATSILRDAARQGEGGGEW